MSEPINHNQRKEYNLKRQIHDLSVDVTTKLLKKEGFINRVKYEDTDLLQIIDNPHAILLIDLDKFKEVNDKYGHPTGDVYLGLISSEIDRIAWNGNGIAFRGKEGDEIVVLLEVGDGNYRDGVREFQDNLSNALFQLDEKLETLKITKKPTVSMGTCFQDGLTDSNTQEKLEKIFLAIDNQCDKALYASKNNVQIGRVRNTFSEYM